MTGPTTRAEAADDTLFDRIGACAVVPVVTVPSADAAVPLARALAAGGIDVIEITLRTGAGLKAIEAVAHAVPEVLTIAGTVVRPEQFAAVRDAGAAMAVSPGFSETLHAAAARADVFWMPGVASASDVMRAVGCGLHRLKFFPAEQAGGLAMLRALGGPFPDVRFCPTGGITLANLAAYLAAANVAAVGGSWLTTGDSVTATDWPAITALARAARRAADEARAVAAPVVRRGAGAVAR